jgi:hypothetical protein
MALVTTQSKPFIQLVELQQKSVDALNKIKESVEQTAERKKADSQTLMLEQTRKLVLIQQESLKLTRKTVLDQAKQMTDLTKQMKNWKTVGDRLGDIKRGLVEAADPTNIKRKLMSAMNVGGMFDKKIADADYIKNQKVRGSTRSTKELKQDAKDMRASGRQALKVNEEIDRMRKTGMSDEDIKKTVKGKELFKQRDYNLDKWNQLNIGTGVLGSKKGATEKTAQPLIQLASDKGKITQSTTDVLADQQQARENQLESLKIAEKQSDLLQQIAANTATMAGKKSSSAGGAEDSGTSGASAGVGDFSKSLKGIGNALGGLGKGVGKAVGGAIGGIFQGIMEGIATGIKAFANIKVLAGVAVLGLLTGVIWGLSKALDNFSKIEWPTIGKAALVIGGLIAAAYAAGAGGLVIGIGVAALLGLAGAVWAIGEAVGIMGDGLERFVTALERLQQIDGDKLSSVGEGLKNLAGAFVSFGLGQAAEGLGNLVSRFLTIGTDSPVERLLKIGEAGPGVQQAATGLSGLSTAMKNFAKVDSDSMKAVREFPWEQATKFVAAGGAMTIKGTQVYAASKGNADEQAKVDASGKQSGGKTSVNTAISNNTTQQNIVKPKSRNDESSYSRYIMSRF